MIHFIVVDALSGTILRTGTCPRNMLFLQENNPNEIVFSGIADDLRHYYDLATAQRMDKGTLVPEIETAPGELVVSNLPDGCLLTVAETGAQGIANAGGLVIDFDLPGKYTLHLSCPPRWMDHTLTIEVP